MGLPGHRRTSSHKHRRAAHFALKAISVNVCEKCKMAALPHRACGNCGWYKGRVAIATAAKRLARMEKASHAGHAHAATPAAKAELGKEKKAAKKVVAKSAANAQIKKMGSGDK